MSGRGKIKRKAKLKAKRIKKKKEGKNVPFNLQNSPKKYGGFKNKYFYQCNIHRLIYKEAMFVNVKFQSSNITKCNYSMAHFNGVDFCHSNLKGCNFKKAVFSDVLFFNCNLEDCDFKDSKFYNVIFISTNIQVAKNLILDETSRVIKEYPKIDIMDKLKNNILALGEEGKLLHPHVLNINKNKINMWMLSILLETTVQDDLSRCMYALKHRKDKRNFYTLKSYLNFIDSYLQR